MTNTTETNGTTNSTPQRVYKDRLFRLIYKDPKELLQLYNAMNDSDYTDADALDIVELENAIYMGMKNDVSFVVNETLLLYEQQSTHNPNMPYRNLQYSARHFERMVSNKNIYGSTLIRLPAPRFVVFYNGIEDRPEREIMKLSDAYEVNEGSPDLELKVLVLNINPGYNTQLLGKCKSLRDYMIYVAKVREYVKTLPLADAVDRAINECIRDDVLADFLRKNRAEAKTMSIFEYDEEKHMKMEREEFFEKGRAEGRAEGHAEGCAEGRSQVEKLVAKLVSDNRIADLKRITEDPKYKEKLYREFGL